MNNVIYRITNQVNGKVYIGLTTQGMKQRQAEHYSRLNRGDRNHKLYLAMKKYGVKSFLFEELFSCFSPDDLGDMERHFIAEHNSFQHGYNMTEGDNSISKETREKLRKVNQGRKITWYDKILESRKNNQNDKRTKYHQLLNSAGMVLEVKDLAQFCKENRLDVSNLHKYKRKEKFLGGYLLLESSTTSLNGVETK